VTVTVAEEVTEVVEAVETSVVTADCVVVLVVVACCC